MSDELTALRAVEKAAREMVEALTSGERPRAELGTALRVALDVAKRTYPELTVSLQGAAQLASKALQARAAYLSPQDSASALVVRNAAFWLDSPEGLACMIAPSAVAQSVTVTIEDEPPPIRFPDTDVARVDWLGADRARLEDVCARLEEMPEGTALRYVIDLLRLEEAEQDDVDRRSFDVLPDPLASDDHAVAPGKDAVVGAGPVRPVARGPMDGRAPAPSVAPRGPARASGPHAPVKP